MGSEESGGKQHFCFIHVSMNCNQMQAVKRTCKKALYLQYFYLHLYKEPIVHMRNLSCPEHRKKSLIRPLTCEHADRRVILKLTPPLRITPAGPGALDPQAHFWILLLKSKK